VPPGIAHGIFMATWVWLHSIFVNRLGQRSYDLPLAGAANTCQMRAVLRMPSWVAGAPISLLRYTLLPQTIGCTKTTGQQTGAMACTGQDPYAVHNSPSFTPGASEVLLL